MHVVLFNLSKERKMWLIYIWQSLVDLLRKVTENDKSMRGANVGPVEGGQESEYLYPIF